MLLDLTQVPDLLASGNARGAAAFAPEEPLRSARPPRAAVAVIFRTDGNQTQLLVIERAEHAGDPWSGHLAFPGGRAEAGDRDALRTALRETREELALDLERHGRLLGALEPVRSQGRGVPELLIEPYAFAMDTSPPLELDPREVARVFWVPVGPLVRGERDTTIEINHGGQRFRMPGYHVEDRVLWGLSYRMLRSFFARVVPG